MNWMRRDLPYLMCLGALVWLAASAFAVAPPNGTECPGQALAAGGQSATLSCGGAVCHGTGNCTLGAAFAPWLDTPQSSDGRPMAVVPGGWNIARNSPS